MCGDAGGLCDAYEALGRGEEHQWPAAGSFFLDQKSNHFKPNSNKALDTLDSNDKTIIMQAEKIQYKCFW